MASRPRSTGDAVGNHEERTLRKQPHTRHRPPLALLLVILSGVANGADLSGEEIVRHCSNKYAGDDQRSRLVIILTDKDGREARSEYRRLWKNYGGRDGIADKVILFGESPLDIRGVNFMRWGYTAKTDKLADQWVYLREMGRVRRVSQRDPNNLAWGYTDEDLRLREPEEDEHHFRGIVHNDGEDFYEVESLPRGESAYSKWVTRFSKGDGWKDCAPRQVDYYDKDGRLFKRQSIRWHRQGDAWIWDRASMHNLRDNITATYLMQNIEVNIGLPDHIFTERQLRRGYPDL